MEVDHSSPGLGSAPEDSPTEPLGDTPTAHRRHGPTLIVLAVGLLITAALVLTSWSLNNHNESRLLDLQAKQVGAVLTAAIPNTQTPLALAAEVAEATGGNVAKFDQFMAGQVGPGRQFASASLWSRADGAVTPIAAVGSVPQLGPTAPATQAFVSRAFGSSSFVVTQLQGGARHYLGYALALPGSSPRYAVYAERPLPADRRASVATNSAFSDLNYAIFLGPTTQQSQLLTTDITAFPVSGRHTTVHVPFGNDQLTVVVSTKGPLAGTLTGWLPWIFAITGVVLSVAAAWITERLVRRRLAAERAETEVRQLYGELGALYGQQRTIAETLQRALLPRTSPDIPGLDVAFRYLPGARGVNIGGDWYSIIGLDEDRFVIVIGDVSGRGLSAASAMAAMRFTIRAYALDGDSPSAILQKCAEQLDIDVDGHFATVLVGVGDVKRHELTLANAGHLSPYLVAGARTGFVPTKVGVPIGIGEGTYEPVTITVPPNATLIAFTDGLVERRNETLDVGLNRLADAVGAGSAPLDDLVEKVVGDLTDEDSDDDIAILAVRWKN